MDNEDEDQIETYKIMMVSIMVYMVNRDSNISYAANPSRVTKKFDIRGTNSHTDGATT